MAGMSAHWIASCVSCGQATVAPFNVSFMQLLSVYILAKLDFKWPNLLEYVIFYSKVFGDSGNISLQNIQQPPEVIRKKEIIHFLCFLGQVLKCRRVVKMKVCTCHFFRIILANKKGGVEGIYKRKCDSCF